MRKVLIPKSHTILELFSLIVFTQFCNSIFIIRINVAAKLQIKIERTKKKGEKLKSCSLIIFLFSLKRLPPLVKEALFQ